MLCSNYLEAVNGAFAVWWLIGRPDAERRIKIMCTENYGKYRSFCEAISMHKASETEQKDSFQNSLSGLLVTIDKAGRQMGNPSQCS